MMEFWKFWALGSNGDVDVQHFSWEFLTQLSGCGMPSRIRRITESPNCRNFHDPDALDLTVVSSALFGSFGCGLWLHASWSCHFVPIFHVHYQASPVISKSQLSKLALQIHRHSKSYQALYPSCSTTVRQHNHHPKRSYVSPRLTFQFTWFLGPIGPKKYVGSI